MILTGKKLDVELQGCRIKSDGLLFFFLFHIIILFRTRLGNAALHPVRAEACIRHQLGRKRADQEETYDANEFHEWRN